MFGQSTRGKCLTGVMANAGFSDVLITRPGVQIVVPVGGMKNKGVAGQLKKDVATRLNDLSVENVLILNEKYGVQIVKASEAVAHNNPTTQEVFA